MSLRGHGLRGRIAGWQCAELCVFGLQCLVSACVHVMMRKGTKPAYYNKFKLTYSPPSALLCVLCCALLPLALDPAAVVSLGDIEQIRRRSPVTGANSQSSVYKAYSGSTTRRRGCSRFERVLSAVSRSLVVSLEDTEAVRRRRLITGADSKLSVHNAYSGSVTHRWDYSGFDRVLSAGSRSLVMSQEGRAHMILFNLCNREGWGGC